MSITTYGTRNRIMRNARHVILDIIRRNSIITLEISYVACLIFRKHWSLKIE